MIRYKPFIIGIVLLCTSVIILLTDALVMLQWQDAVQNSAQRHDHTLFVSLWSIAAGLVLGGSAILLFFRVHTQTLQESQRLLYLQEEQAVYFHNILDTATDLAIVATDAQLRIRYFNPAAAVIFEENARQVTGQTMVEIFTRRQVSQEWLQQGLEAIQTGQEYRLTIELGPEERRRTVDLRASDIRADDQKLVGYLLLCRDITEQTHAERLLIRSEKKFRNLIESANDAIFVADADTGLLVDANPKAEELVGRSAHELIGQSMTILHPPEEVERYRTLFHEHVHSGGIDTVEAEIVHKNGRRIAVEIRAGVSDLGEVRLMHGNFRDVTQRKQTQAALQQALHHAAESRATLQAILDRAIALIFLKDLQGRYLLVNRAFEELVARTSPEILGCTDFELFSSPMAQVYQDNDRRALQTHLLEIEELFTREDGFHTYISVKFPLLDVHGTPYAVAGVATDITERKLMEKALRENERFARSTIDALPDPLCVLDETGTILAVNQAWQRLSAAHDSPLPCGKLMEGDNYLTAIVQHPHYSLSSPGEQFRVGIQKLIQGEQQQFFLEFPSCNPRNAQWFAGRINRFPGNGPLRLVVVQQDITGVKQAEQMLRHLTQILDERVARRTRELELSNQDLQQFAYVASHDLQEPLRQVSGFVQLLQRQYRGQLDAKADQFIDFTVEGCQRMQELINSLLSYSRVGTHAIHPQPMAGDTLLHRAMDNLRTTIEESAAVISHDTLPDLWCDGQQMILVFQNLLSNAIKFRQPDHCPHIEITAQRHESTWILSVKDDGIGMEAQHLERIFEIFQRLNSRTAYSGTGIGLAICKRILERHNGWIRVTSIPEQGSTFLFMLPIPDEMTPGV